MAKDAEIPVTNDKESGGPTIVSEIEALNNIARETASIYKRLDRLATWIEVVIILAVLGAVLVCLFGGMTALG
jgi:hypothetical protein